MHSPKQDRNGWVCAFDPCADNRNERELCCHRAGGDKVTTKSIHDFVNSRIKGTIGAQHPALNLVPSFF